MTSTGDAIRLQALSARLLAGEVAVERAKLASQCEQTVWQATSGDEARRMIGAFLTRLEGAHNDALALAESLEAHAVAVEAKEANKPWQECHPAPMYPGWNDKSLVRNR